MKYLWMVYVDEKNLNALSKRESAELDVSRAFRTTMSFRKSGQRIAAQALESVESATTLRIQNGKVALTDGPFGLGGEARMDCGNSTKSIPDQARQFRAALSQRDRR